MSLEGMINDFGQTPTQLLTTPHPQRMTQEEAAARKAKALETTGSTRQLYSVFEYLDKLKAYFVEVNTLIYFTVFVWKNKATKVLIFLLSIIVFTQLLCIYIG